MQRIQKDDNTKKSKFFLTYDLFVQLSMHDATDMEDKEVRNTT